MPSRRAADKPPRVAIVSDPLVQRGGAERVVEAMSEAFPDAPIFALLYSPENGPSSISSRVSTSWLQRLPGAVSKHRVFLPFFPLAIESFDLSGFDLILSSHHSVAKGLLRGADQVHVCYCHTTMRALWERPNAELQTLPAFARLPASAIFGKLRVWDYASAARVDVFLANSRVTQQRIRRHYGRESRLLPPPIDIERFTLGPPSSESTPPYYLIASRPVPYKRVDVAVAAAIAMNRRVVLTGGVHRNVPRHPLVDNIGVVDDRRLVELMRGARALLFPQYEDFGMAPLEMNACGRPAIALAAGGALETVIDGRTGILVAEQSADGFARGIERLEATRFDPLVLREHASSFSRRSFVDRLRLEVEAAWHESNNVSSE